MKMATNPTKAKSHPPLVSIVIVSYNGLKFLGQCLRSVFETRYPNFEAILIDNASNDGSISYVRELFKKEPRLTIIENDKNLGFAGGNNMGIKFANGKYVIFLNQDTKVDPDWIDKLVEVMESDEQIGICQSKLLSLINHKLFDSAGDIVDYYGVSIRRGGDVHEEDKGQYDKLEEIFSARGAAMIIRKELIRKIGGFSSELLISDVDFCWRARLAGYKIFFVPKSIVYHVGEASTSSSFKVYHTTKNLIATLIRNYDFRNLIRYAPFTVAITFCAVLYELGRKNPKLALCRFKGVLWIVKHFRQLWTARLNIQRCVRLVNDSTIKRQMSPRPLFIRYWHSTR